MTLVICLIYIFLGRKYLHRLTASTASRTNIDTIIGKTGVVLQKISPDTAGLVKVGNEEWRAIAEQSLEKDTAVIVTSIHGVTLTVKRYLKEGKI